MFAGYGVGVMEDKEASKEVNITYETLFELLRREKDRESLQKLQDSFFNDVLEYLKEKQVILDRSGEGLFDSDEKESTREQLKNIMGILKKLYERREKKIMSMAVNKSITQSNIIDTGALLKEEKAMFQSLVATLNTYRAGVLNNVLSMKNVEVKDMCEEKKEVEKKEEKDTRFVRFLHAVPKFVGTDLQVYGPFEEEDMANLPSKIAEVLIEKKRAEEIKEQ